MHVQLHELNALRSNTVVVQYLHKDHNMRDADDIPNGLLLKIYEWIQPKDEK